MKICTADESTRLMKLIHMSRVVSSVSNRGVLIDVVTRWGVSCRLRRHRYFFQAKALRLSSVQGDDSCWQFLAPLLLSPHQVEPPPASSSSFYLHPSVSHPVSLRHVSLSHIPPQPFSPHSDSVSHYCSPGARCRILVSAGAIFPLVFSGQLLHCQCYYINRKQWSCYSAIYSTPPLSLHLPHLDAYLSLTKQIFVCWYFLLTHCGENCILLWSLFWWHSLFLLLFRLTGK